MTRKVIGCFFSFNLIPLFLKSHKGQFHDADDDDDDNDDLEMW